MAEKNASETTARGRQQACRPTQAVAEKRHRLATRTPSAPRAGSRRGLEAFPVQQQGVFAHKMLFVSWVIHQCIVLRKRGLVEGEKRRVF
jgi:hypothetical protein